MTDTAHNQIGDTAARSDSATGLVNDLAAQAAHLLRFDEITIRPASVPGSIIVGGVIWNDNEEDPEPSDGEVHLHYSPTEATVSVALPDETDAQGRLLVTLPVNALVAALVAGAMAP